MSKQDSSRSIGQWTTALKTLYREADKERTPEEFWNATMAHISKIGEAIRRTNYPVLIDAAVHAFVWMTGYVGKCNELKDDVFSIENSLSQIVAFKYPDKCGHCVRAICSCNPHEMDKKEDKSAKYSELYVDWERHEKSWNDYSINLWQGVFWKIFSGQIHMSSMESIGFHLLEEAGEEAMAVRQLIQFRGILQANIEGINVEYLRKISSIPGILNEYKTSVTELREITGKKTEKEALQAIDYSSDDQTLIKARLVKGKIDFIIEIADTFSWFCSVLLKLKNDIIEHMKLNADEKKNYNLEEKLKDIYKSKDKTQKLKCYKCKETLCKCAFFLKSHELESGSEKKN